MNSYYFSKPHTNSTSLGLQNTVHVDDAGPGKCIEANTVDDATADYRENHGSCRFIIARHVI